jgi:hypothetical protein
VECEEGWIPMTIKDPDGEEHEYYTKRNGIDDHTLGIELQMLLVPGADTSNAYHQESHDLTAKHVTVLVNIHKFEPAMEVSEYSTPKVQDFWGYGILKELNYQREVDESTEYLI